MDLSQLFTECHAELELIERVGAAAVEKRQLFGFCTKKKPFSVIFVCRGVHGIKVNNKLDLKGGNTKKILI